MKNLLLNNEFNGFLLLDKPHSVSSCKFLSSFKRDKNFKKIGHTGTLDPFATGLLIVALNRATKFIQFLPDMKEYVFSIKFGVRTDSDDYDGVFIERNDKVPLLNDIEKIVPNFIGNIVQRPSKFSAIKINGQRSYKLARLGLDFETPMRNVQIHSLSLLSFENDIANFCVKCSGGTYVRSLMSDICSAIGVIGCVDSLRRTCSNGFRLSNSLEDISSYSLDCFLDFYSHLFLSNEQILKINHGLKFEFDHEDGIFCLCDFDKKFLGLVAVNDKIISRLCLI